VFPATCGISELPFVCKMSRKWIFFLIILYKAGILTIYSSPACQTNDGSFCIGSEPTAMPVTGPDVGLIVGIIVIILVIIAVIGE